MPLARPLSLTAAALVLAAGTGAVVLIASDAAAAVEVVRRVGGDPNVQTEYKSGAYVAGRFRVEERLPDGYPPPTPPGAIELKRYPSVRRAEISGTMDPDMGRNAGFYPLARHINERDIAMTAPVELDLEGGGDAREPSWTMSFLYKSPDLGPLGADGDVRVVDTEPVTVVALGYAGSYMAARSRDALDALRAWLDGQDEWEAAGPPRVMYYNGPSVPNARKWGEVQIPVEQAGGGETTASAAPAPSRDAAPSRGVRDLVILAIERGAPLFNDHQPGACAAVYELTAESLLLLDDEAFPAAARARVRDALDEARSQHDMRRRAWTLRDALDDVLEMSGATAGR